MTRLLRSALLAVILAGTATLAVQPARADGDGRGWHQEDRGWHRDWHRDRGDWDERGPRWGVAIAPRAYYPPPPVYYAPPPPPPVFFAPGFTVGIGVR